MERGVLVKPTNCLANSLDSGVGVGVNSDGEFVSINNPFCVPPKKRGLLSLPITVNTSASILVKLGSSGQNVYRCIECHANCGSRRG